MPRATSGPATRQRRKKYLKIAKGFRASRGNLYRQVREAVDKARQYSYRDRKARKRDFRRLWIARINAAARLNGLSYSRFMDGLKRAQIEVDRKILAELAISDAPSFAQLVETAKAQLSS